MPLLTVRQEPKPYGLRNSVEGAFHRHDHVILLEDVLMSGLSTYEACKKLVDGTGLFVDFVIVLLDRQQGGRDNLQEMGLNVISLSTLPDMIDILAQQLARLRMPNAVPSFPP